MAACTWKDRPTDERICGLVAQAGSVYCPRHTFLYNLAKQKREAREGEKARKLGKAMENTRRALITLGYVFKGNNNCRDCHEPIEWWTTPNKRQAPYNPMPDENSHAVSHFATCKFAAHFRRSA